MNLILEKKLTPEEVKQIRKFISLLRKYKNQQGYGRLVRKMPGKNSPYCYCAAGILLKSMGYKTAYKGSCKTLCFKVGKSYYVGVPTRAIKYLSRINHDRLINLNDTLRMSFENIADMLERELSGILEAKN